MKKDLGVYNVILIIVLVLSLLMFAFEGAIFTGKAISGTAPSEVVIQKYLSIQLSQELQDGIDFGMVSELPAVNVPAIENNQSVGGGTLYYINISEDGNTAVDFCVSGSGDLMTIGADLIPLSNERYATGTSDDNLSLSVGSSFPFSTIYENSISGVSTGEAAFYRFWLSVDVAQAAGVYNNTINFKGIVSGGSC